MIISIKPLDISEAKELAGDVEERKNLAEYFKKFCKVELKDAKSLAEELRALNNVKIKEEYVSKVIDFLPKDSEDLNKIFTDVSLDEKETATILEIVKKY